MMEKNCKENINGKDSERFGKIRITTYNYKLFSCLCVFMFFVLISFSSCNSEIKEAKVANEDASIFQLDEKVCTDFAVKMHTSLVNGDTNFINSYIDWSGIKDLIAEDSSYWDKVNTDIFNTWKSEISVGQDLIGELVSGSHLRFITYYQLDGEHFIMLRNYIEPQTVNYFEFKLVAIGKSIAIADVYDFGQSMLLSSMSKDYCDYYSGFNSEWKTVRTETEGKLMEINSKLAEGNLKEAYAKLKGMETTFQNTYMYLNVKETILLQSNVASVTQNYLYEKSQRIALNEKGRSLTMFYLNAYVGNNNDALIALANIEDAVGEDGVIDYLRGNLYFESGQMQKALEAFNAALAYNNEIFSFHVAKIKALIEQLAYVEAVESLLVMDDSFDIKNLSWEEEFKSYPEFLASESYADWKIRLNEEVK